MTATVTQRADLGKPAGFGGVLRAEWTKIRSVQSTLWTLILFVVIMIGLTTGITALIVSTWKSSPPEQRLAVAADPTGFLLSLGIGFGQLTICVLGVLVITTEYSTGVIRSSLMAVPRRLVMLGGKVLVFATLVLVLSEIVVFCSFLAGAAILHSKVAVALGDPGVTRAVIGAGLYLTVLSVFSLAIGALIRHTAGAIAAVIGVVLVLPIITGFLPGSWGKHINAYLPEQAGALIYATPTRSAPLLTAWQGFGVFCLWTLILLVAAAVLLRERDA